MNLQTIRGRHRAEAPLLSTVSGVASTSPSVIDWFARDTCIDIITTKSIEREANPGNREPVITEPRPGCFGNAVGLRNPGVVAAVAQLAALRERWSERWSAGPAREDASCGEAAGPAREDASRGDGGWARDVPRGDAAGCWAEDEPCGDGAGCRPGDVPCGDGGWVAPREGGAEWGAGDVPCGDGGLGRAARAGTWKARDQVAAGSRAGAPLLNVSLSASCEADFVLLARALSPVADLLELNFSCPHAAAGYGAAIGGSVKAVGRITRAVKAAASVPVLTKLTPNVEDIAAVASAAVAGGADGIVAINTVGPTRYLEADSGSQVLTNAPGGQGGMSGEWVYELALDAVASIRRVVGPGIAVIGMGGVSSRDHVREMHRAGADAVGIGSVLATLHQRHWAGFLSSLKCPDSGAKLAGDAGAPDSGAKLAGKAGAPDSGAKLGGNAGAGANRVERSQYSVVSYDDSGACAGTEEIRRSVPRSVETARRAGTARHGGGGTEVGSGGGVPGNTPRSATVQAAVCTTATQMSYRRATVARVEHLGPAIAEITLEERIDVGPGQTVFLWIPEVGEKPFAVASCRPAVFLVKEKGTFTQALVGLSAGSRLYLRGPYGDVHRARERIRGAEWDIQGAERGRDARGVAEDAQGAKRDAREAARQSGDGGTRPAKRDAREAARQSGDGGTRPGGVARQNGDGGTRPRVLMVVAGTGLAAVSSLATGLIRDGVEVRLLVGLRDAETRPPLRGNTVLCSATEIVYDRGVLGRVLDTYADVIAAEAPPAAVYAVGPEPFMKRAAGLALRAGLPPERVFLSLERTMLCGVGLCGACDCGGKLTCQYGTFVTAGAFND